MRRFCLARTCKAKASSHKQHPNYHRLPRLIESAARVAVDISERLAAGSVVLKKP